MKLTLLFSYGSSHQRSQDANSTGLTGNFGKKNSNNNNTTMVGSTTMGSTFDTSTFEYGNEFINYECKRLENIDNQYHFNNEFTTITTSATDTIVMAPTLSSTIAKKLNDNHHHHHNPLVYNGDHHDSSIAYIYSEHHADCDPSHQFVYNESTKSSTQLVEEHHY